MEIGAEDRDGQRKVDADRGKSTIYAAFRGETSKRHQVAIDWQNLGEAHTGSDAKLKVAEHIYENINTSYI